MKAENWHVGSPAKELRIKILVAFKLEMGHINKTI